MQLFIRRSCPMIAAPVQRGVDGIPKGSHDTSVLPTVGHSEPHTGHHRKIGDMRQRTIARALFVPLVLASMVLGVYLLYPSGWHGYKRGSAKFDSSTWKSYRNTGSTYRWCALDDLLA